jgi:hypothetical protein
VWIPYAVEMQGQIVTVFDPLVHMSREEIMPADCDRRWVLCRRPRVIVGGELTMEVLDLQFNPSLGFYSARLQMKANNGILIIDDFGRQRIKPAELLNRWIVPLDRRIDFLTLAGGARSKSREQERGSKLCRTPKLRLLCRAAWTSCHGNNHKINDNKTRQNIFLSI